MSTESRFRVRENDALLRCDFDERSNESADVVIVKCIRGQTWNENCVFFFAAACCRTHPALFAGLPFSIPPFDCDRFLPPHRPSAFRVRPSAARARPSALASLAALEDGWGLIKPAINRLEKLLDDRFVLSADSAEGGAAGGGAPPSGTSLFTIEHSSRLYHTCYKMSTQRQPNNFSEALYNRHGECVRDYLRKSVLPALQREKGRGAPALLGELALHWGHMDVLNKWHAKFFMYLNRFYVPYHNKPTLTVRRMLLSIPLLVAPRRNEINGPTAPSAPAAGTRGRTCEAASLAVMAAEGIDCSARTTAVLPPLQLQRSCRNVQIHARSHAPSAGARCLRDRCLASGVLNWWRSFYAHSTRKAYPAPIAVS